MFDKINILTILRNINVKIAKMSINKQAPPKVFDSLPIW